VKSFPNPTPPPYHSRLSRRPHLLFYPSFHAPPKDAAELNIPDLKAYRESFMFLLHVNSVRTRASRPDGLFFTSGRPERPVFLANSFRTALSRFLLRNKRVVFGGWRSFSLAVFHTFRDWPLGLLKDPTAALVCVVVAVYFFPP